MLNMKDDDYEREIVNFDSKTDTDELKISVSEEDYNKIKKDYEKYLKTKNNTEEVVSLDEFFEIMYNIGLYKIELDFKKKYMDLLKIEIENLEKTIEDYKLKL